MNLIDRYPLLAAAEVLELDLAVNQGKEGEVTAHTDVLSGVDFGATLAHQDVACADALACVAFYATALGIAISAVIGGASGLFMSHNGGILGILGHLARNFLP